jgi:hypothetical protein
MVNPGNYPQVSDLSAAARQLNRWSPPLG